MRFFELLQRVRFEDMVPILKEFCISDRQPVGQLAYYKQAFDCLRLMKPEINDGTMRVGMSDGDGDFWARNPARFSEKSMTGIRYLSGILNVSCVQESISR